MDDLIEALQIFRKYGNPKDPFHCEHDVLMVNYDPENIGDQDTKRLYELGFFAEDDCFKSYRFGSC